VTRAGGTVPLFDEGTGEEFDELPGVLVTEYSNYYEMTGESWSVQIMKVSER